MRAVPCTSSEAGRRANGYEWKEVRRVRRCGGAVLGDDDQRRRIPRHLLGRTSQARSEGAFRARTRSGAPGRGLEDRKLTSRPSAYGLRAKIPTMPTRRDTSTGFTMWYWNPAPRTRAGLPDWRAP